MEIRFNKNLNFSPLKKAETKQTPPINPEKEKGDSFVKGPSFGSSFGGFDLVDAILDGIFEAAILSSCMEIVNECARRSAVNAFLEEMASIAKSFNNFSSISLNDLTDAVFSDMPYGKGAKQYIDDLFAQANIKSPMNFKLFLTTYSKAARNYQEISSNGPEAMKIYGKLSSKDDLQNFPELLLYFESESESSNNDVDVAEYTSFIKSLGIKDEKEFYKKFAHLGEKFNDFEETKDKVDALLYVKSSYAKKIEAIKSALSNVKELRSEKAEKLYLKVADIIDYLYETDPNNFEEKLSKLIETIAKEQRLTSRTKASIGLFEDISTPQKRIEFFEFLLTEGIPIDELNELLRIEAVEDLDVEHVLLDRNGILERLSDIKGTSKDKVKTYYLNHKEMLHSAVCFDDETYSSDGLKAAINVIDKFEIKNDKDFLNKYSAIFEPKQQAKTNSKNKKQNSGHSKKITGRQAREAIELLNFADDEISSKFLKNKNYPIIEKLTDKKQEFETLLPAIKEFLDSSECFFLSGQTPYEVFLQYKALSSSLDIETFFENIKSTQTTDANEYREELRAYDDFRQYFEDKNELDAFISKNGIKFDSSNESKVYRQNCLRVLNALCDEKDEQLSKQYIQKLANNSFIKNSQSGLSVFLDRAEKTVGIKLLFETILDKNIQSAKEIKMLERLYKNDNDEYDKVLEHFRKTSPDIDFDAYISGLKRIQASFNNAGMPVKINNDNLFAIDDSFIQKEGKIVQNKLISLAQEMTKNKGANFISAQDKAFTKDEMTLSAYEIAVEIVNRASKSDESYQNTIRELHLSKEELGLKDDSTRADYIYAISRSIPKEFIDFINDKSWRTIGGNNMQANMRLHARMRAVDRFALNGANSLEKLNSSETKDKMKNVLETVYTKAPTRITKGQKDDDRFEAVFSYGDEEIKAVFLSNGEMITIVKG